MRNEINTSQVTFAGRKFASRLIIGTFALFIWWGESGLAQDQIPQTTGFGGFVIFSPGVAYIETNLLASGAPALGELGQAEITSILDLPGSETTMIAPIGGEINYTFGKSRTQLYFGNRLEDLLRFDLVFGGGIRQELRDSSIVAVSILTTPVPRKFWEDPFVEGEERVKTTLRNPGFRIRWGSMFRTGLELTTTYRRYDYEEEFSGAWLVDQGRLTITERDLLNRSGRRWIVQALYRIEKGPHRFEPGIIYINDNREGEAISANRYRVKATYLYSKPKFLLDFSVDYNFHRAKDINPVFDELLTGHRYGFALAAVFPFKFYERSVLSFIFTTENVRDNTSIPFYDSRLFSINAGLAWRYLRQ